MPAYGTEFSLQLATLLAAWTLLLGFGELAESGFALLAFWCFASTVGQSLPLLAARAFHLSQAGYDMLFAAVVAPLLMAWLGWLGSLRAGWSSPDPLENLQRALVALLVPFLWQYGRGSRLLDPHLRSACGIRYAAFPPPDGAEDPDGVQLRDFEEDDQKRFLDDFEHVLLQLELDPIDAGLRLAGFLVLAEAALLRWVPLPAGWPGHLVQQAGVAALAWGYMAGFVRFGQLRNARYQLLRLWSAEALRRTGRLVAFTVGTDRRLRLRLFDAGAVGRAERVRFEGELHLVLHPATLDFRRCMAHARVARAPWAFQASLRAWKPA